MIILKEYIGKHENTHGFTHYYMINKNSLYGIELVDENTSGVISTSEWFSEDHDRTLALAHLLCSHGASSIHLDEIIDNFTE